MYEERFKNSFSVFYASRETSVFTAYAVNSREEVMIFFQKASFLSNSWRVKINIARVKKKWYSTLT